MRPGADHPEGSSGDTSYTHRGHDSHFSTKSDTDVCYRELPNCERLARALERLEASPAEAPGSIPVPLRGVKTEAKVACFSRQRPLLSH